MLEFDGASWARERAAWRIDLDTGWGRNWRIERRARMQEEAEKEEFSSMTEE
jgi:hypothetical protein